MQLPHRAVSVTYVAAARPAPRATHAIGRTSNQKKSGARMRSMAKTITLRARLRTAHINIFSLSLSLFFFFLFFYFFFVFSLLWAHKAPCTLCVKERSGVLRGWSVATAARFSGRWRSAACSCQHVLQEGTRTRADAGPRTFLRLKLSFFLSSFIPPIFSLSLSLSLSLLVREVAQEKSVSFLSRVLCRRFCRRDAEKYAVVGGDVLEAEHAIDSLCGIHVPPVPNIPYMRRACGDVHVIAEAERKVYRGKSVPISRARAIRSTATAPLPWWFDHTCQALPALSTPDPASGWPCWIREASASDSTRGHISSINVAFERSKDRVSG